MTLDRALARTAELAAGNIPPVIRAHHAVFVLLPTLARDIGVEAVAEQVGKFVRDTLANKLDLCSVCYTESVAGEDGVFRACPKCDAELEEFAGPLPPQ